MEILPLSHKETDGMDWRAPDKYRPTCVMGWLRDDEGQERVLIWSPQTQLWLSGDGQSPAKPLPTKDQYLITQLMAPNLKALRSAKRIVEE